MSQSEPPRPHDPLARVQALQRGIEADHRALQERWAKVGSTLAVDDQIVWYERKATISKAYYTRLKVASLVIATSIPVLASTNVPRVAFGIAGAAIVLLEALQQLFQFQQNWVTYRSAAEGLKHEKFLYLARAGDYSADTDPDRLLQRRVESLLAEDYARWSTPT